MHRVLLVDDNPDVRAIVAKQLEHLGYRVDTTADAGEFLGKIASVNQSYELAVVDIRLPGLTGDKIISWLRNSEDHRVQNLPVVIITGFVDEVPKHLIDGSAAPKILEKPFTIKELESSVRSATVGHLLH